MTATRSIFVAMTFVLASFAAARADSKDQPVSFNRDIRPILSEFCFQCHGPDAKQRKGELRLDSDEQLFVDRDGHRVLAAGDPAKSELFRRLTSVDADEQMPPASLGKKPTPVQKDLIRRWIEQGAKWEKHWSLIPPTRPTLPRISEFKSEISNSLDRFVLARLEREGLKSSAPASKATLLRRVTLDLTGLPPSLDEIDDFLKDDSPDAYERVVDRLLASPRFGERFARPWLDAARYADTSGYQSDGDRSMWRWRDWVIDAFNDNQPFDEFTIEQLAGDLLPDATLDQVLATGFNRNHRGNAEGGIIPEEYAVEYVVDRVDTTATVWLGLTLGCCRCHDHKFDPFTQREYYQLYAFFNNVPERGRAVKFGNSPPFVKTPTREQQRQLRALQFEQGFVKGFSERLMETVPTVQAAWERRLTQNLPGEIDWTVTRGEVLHLPFDRDGQPAPARPDAAKKDKVQPPPLGPVSGPPVIKEADRVAVELGEGRFGKAALFDGERRFVVGDVANIGFFEPFSMSAWIRSDAASGTILSRMSDDSNSDGYNLCLDDGKLQLNLAKRWLDDALRVETAEAIPLGQWVHVGVSYDGSRFAGGVKLFVNGQLAKPRVVLDELNQAFASKDVFRIGYGGLTPPFRGAIDDVRLFDVQLDDDEMAILSVPDSVSRIASLPANKRSAAQSNKLRECFLADHAPAEIRDVHRKLRQLQLEERQFVDVFPTTMVMQETPELRPTHVLLRGAYDRPGERVSRDVPKALPVTLPKSERVNRLDLARWLISADNPLTARVIVNRFWTQLFGQGIVKTVDDFGSQGDWPSHLELLDWLAVEFSGPADGHEPFSPRWDIKRLIRGLVTSATYRQSSQATVELLARDPDNRLLARGPRTRLSAEMVRDQALAASGLLTERLGGPSIKPYQPEGLWDDLQSTEKYVQDHGSALYRRGLYVFWKRTIAPPMMVTFDAAGRETCIVRETRTNTPLQALTLLNEVSFVEAARKLAERTLTSGSAGRGVERHLAHYREHRDEAAAVSRAGESASDASLDPVEVAAWTAVCGLILNLDEAVTKE
ncbi:MAG: hypothetical protein FD138_1211 [Planctomycetota bacterium]|nr:MAG: hypothetical protein FD138_1211 [Planctomycetota bacterium]